MMGRSGYAALRASEGKDVGKKPEKYIRLIKEKSERLAKAITLHGAGNGQPQMD